MATQDLSLGRGWSDDFIGWSEELLLGRKLKKPAKAPRPSSGWTGAAVKPRTPTPYPGRGSKADVYGRLEGMARRRRQVVVKVTGSSKTSGGLKSHLDYLSRNGELPLRDQNNNDVEGRDALRDVVWGWKHGGPQWDESGQTKQALHIVFSMPQGTDEKALFHAVKATANSEFAGHQWAMVQHFDEPQVHAHVCVKMEGPDGQRLNPRKADLHRWRERFAYELRERGVEAEATRRVPRLQREKINKPWAVTRLEERGQATHPAPDAPAQARAEGWARNERKAVDNYSRIIGALSASEDPNDRALAKGLEQARDQELAKRSATRGGRSNPTEPNRSPPELDRG